MSHAPAPLILIADDDMDLRAMLRMLLERDGYRIVEAAPWRRSGGTVQAAAARRRAAGHPDADHGWRGGLRPHSDAAGRRAACRC